MLQELIEATEKLCRNLDIASQNEKKFTIDICLQLEKYTLEMHRMSSDLQQIKDYVGEEVRRCA